MAPLLRCLLSLAKLKAGDIITTGQYMKYQTFSNLQFRPLLRISFISVHIDLRNTSSKKIPLVSVGVTRFVLMLKKASNIHISPKRRYKMIASREVRFPFFRRKYWSTKWTTIRRTFINYCKNCSSIFA